MEKLSETKIETGLWLRNEKRFSIKEIARAMGISPASASKYLKKTKLSEKELKERRQKGIELVSKNKLALKKQSEAENHKRYPSRGMSPSQKGRLAETAVIYRLAVMGILVYTPPYDGDACDFLADTPRGLLKIQVKWASKGKYGSPRVALRRFSRNVPKLYSKGDLDVLIGYHYFSDSFYLWNWEEVEGQSSKTCDAEAKGAFSKLGVEIS